MLSKALLLLLGIMSYYWTPAQMSKKDEINFSDPFQVDNSEYYMIPRLIDNENKDAYGKGKGYLSWENYHDIYFYNSKTNETKKLFGSTLAIISSFNPRRYYNEKPADTPANILDNHIVFLARTENYNKDNGLDSEDPVYLYLSAKTGEQLTQITPKGMHVVSWTCSKDRKMILVKLLQDKNDNRKFGVGDDEQYYRIDLDDDMANTRCYQINIAR